MENLIFALNSTMPVFLLMILGMIFRKAGIIDDVFASKMNKFVFLIPLPVKVFEDLAVVDFSESLDLKFILFCFAATFLCVVIAFLLSHLIHDLSARGEFIQASYRSSAALLGIAFITNIYGNSGMAPMMIIGAVPLYNIVAVVVLTLMKPDSEGLTKAAVRKTLIGILKNPILIGIEIGLLWSLLRLPLTGILAKTVSNVSATATPLGLMAMGASIDLKKALGTAKPAVGATFMKLIGFCAIFIPIAAALGFRDEKMVAIVVMLGSATTVSSYVMARNMGHDGTISSSTVVLTTMLSAVTLTFWLWLTRSLGLI